MNLINKFVQALQTLFVSCVLLLFLSSSAIAATTCINPPPVPIKGGSFNVDIHPNVPKDITVRSAVVSLPQDINGTIDEIVITGPDGQREFGCSQIKNVKNGTNLIQACGGPAVLKAGATTYKAKGSKFSTKANIPNFSIKLCDEF